MNQLPSGLDEDGNLLTYGAAALYAGHVVDVLDDYFHYRHWSDDFAARDRPARRAVTVVIDDALRPIRPDSRPE